MTKQFLVLLPLLALHGPLTGAAPKRGDVIDPEAPRLEAGAVVTGVEEGGTYLDLPPVLVELSGLDRKTKLWVEVRRGPSGAKASGSILVDHRKISWLEEVGILNVPGLEKVCTEEGPWTLVVLMKDCLGTNLLAKTSFHICAKEEIAVNGLILRP